MKFLVCRVDAIERTIKSSELFPTIVEFDEHTPHDVIVQETLQSVWPGYEPRNKAYYVVPLTDATIVTFKPKTQYDITVKRVMWP